MRLSLKKRIFAVLLCCCVVFTSGCFPIHSILGDESYDLTLSGSLDLDFKMMSQNQVVSGEYPDGKRAFKFKNCTYEADISDFRLIDVVGNVTIYYYTGITVLNDDEVGMGSESSSDSDSDSDFLNKKGYYDRTRAKLKHFWTIAAYNFETEEYTELHSQQYYLPGDAGKMNGNPVLCYKDSTEGRYIINVGYFFIEIYALRSDFYNAIYSGDYSGLDENCKDYFCFRSDIWKLSDDNKKEIREYLGIKGDDNNFCCTDLAAKNLANYRDLKFAASFMKLPTDEDFDQKNVMIEVRLQIDDDGNKVIKLHTKEKNVKTVSGGNILSSNYTSGNCVYVVNSNSKDNGIIRFGIDNRDRRTRFEIDIGNTTNENNVLQSFSVKDYIDTDDDGNEFVSDEESRLELVFKNRIVYYKIERYKQGVSTEYRAISLKTYWLNEFSSTYLSSDDIPSILDLPWGVNISSATDGFRCIKEAGNTHWSSLSGAAYCSFRYGGLTLVIGFDGFEFDKTVRYFDDDGNQTGISKSKSEFTMAQLPFATVRIV